jgi:hypothetical protein
MIEYVISSDEIIANQCYVVLYGMLDQNVKKLKFVCRYTFCERKVVNNQQFHIVYKFETNINDILFENHV